MIHGTRRKMSALSAALTAAAAAVVMSAGGVRAGEVLTNADVTAMLRSGIDASTVIAKINASANAFDTSASSLIGLQAANVPRDVVNAMIAAAGPARPAAEGTTRDRFSLELVSIARGTPEARTGALAWMQANRAETVPALRQMLGDQSPEMRLAAMTALASMQDRDSLPAMRTLITDSAPMVRHTAARVLAEMNDTESINAAETILSRPLNNLDGYARLAGHARLTRAAGVLGRVLSSNPESEARAAAAWAIGEIGRPGAAGRPALETALETDPDPAVRREAAAALAKFHDEQSARMLEEACRRDYEVRRVTLAALAEYPESAGFLVGVMNLGPDQIAADERETARASLVRLSGRDFGTDGTQWSQWLAENGSRFRSGGSFPAASGSTSLSGGMPRRQQLDVEAWSIVADSAAIPVAPQAENRTAAGPGGIPQLQLGGAASGPMPQAGPSLPFSPSASEFESAVPDLGRPSGLGMSMPELSGGIPYSPVTEEPPAGLMEGPAEGPQLPESAPMFRTWSPAGADDAAAAPADRPSAPAAAPEAHPLRPSSAGMAASPGSAGGIPEWIDPGSGPAAYDDDDDSGYSSAGGRASERIPISSVVSPMPPASVPSFRDESPLTGITLSLPGMGPPADAAPSESVTAFSEPPDFDTGAPEGAALLSPYGGEVDDSSFYYDGNFEAVADESDLLTGPEMGSSSSAFDFGGDVFAPAGQDDLFADPYAGSPGGLSGGLSGSLSAGTAPAENDPFETPDFSFDSFPPASGDEALLYQPLSDFGGDEAAAPAESAGSDLGLTFPPADSAPDMFAAPPADDGSADAFSAGAGSDYDIFADTDTETLFGDPVDFSGPSFAEPETAWQDPAETEAAQPGAEDSFGGMETEAAFTGDSGTPDNLEMTGEPDAAPAEEYTFESAPVEDPVYESVPPVFESASEYTSEYTMEPILVPAPAVSDPFSSFESSMPPVKAEGTVSAPPGKDVPLLGEGMFKR